MNPFEALLHSIRSQLHGNETREQLIELLTAAGIPTAFVDGLIDQLQPERPPPAPSTVPTPPLAGASAVDNSQRYPRLLVDWGVHPQVGHHARPQFMILCPENYRARPRVELQIDHHLDSHGHADQYQPVSQGEGLWEFHASFGMTTNGQDCRPGQYLLRLRLAFDDATDDALPRSFHCTLRLTVAQPSTSERTLEIDGDGQSIVNLHGHDLKSFSRIVLKGSESGIVNLQSPLSQLTADHPADARPEIVTHEYQLRIDEERRERSPRVTPGSTRQILDAAALVFETGKRVLLLPKRRIALGRSRENDVVVRFMPGGEANDRHSKNISRTHLVVMLQEEGLLLTDLSKTGVSLDFEALEGDRLLTSAEGAEALELELGITQRLELEPFVATIELFGQDDRQSSSAAAERDAIYADVLGESIPRLWRLSHASRIDAARVQRRNNLIGLEEYTFLYRQALIGSSGHRCAICLASTSLPAVVARVFHIGQVFWLESSGTAELVHVNGQPLLPLRPHPLVVGASLRFGDVECRFEAYEQLHL